VQLARLASVTGRWAYTITLAVFVPFAVMYMNQPVKLDFLWAGLCLLGAVYFIFRS